MGDSGRRTFIIASTGDRKNGLIRLLFSLKPFFDSGWTAVVVAQGYSEQDILDVRSMCGGNVVIVCSKHLVGAHSAKIVALNRVQSDVWCSLDDDMYAIQATDYDKMADILLNDRSIGFISGNWARTEKQAHNKQVIDNLVPQKLVFTGGGLLFREDVAEIIRHIPNEQYLFDDCLWAMYAYINGYNNFRYRGSVTVHEICTVGGRRTWIKETTARQRILPPPELLRVRRGKGKEGYNEYLICMDSDLTEMAHKLHKERLKCP